MLLGICQGPCYTRARFFLQDMHPFVDGVEIRLDSFAKIDIGEIKGLLQGFTKKVVFTLRANLDEEMLYNLWQDLLSLRPDYIDLDYKTPEKIKQLVFSNTLGTELILSYHDFTSSEGIEQIFEKLSQYPSHIYKIATMATSSTDSLKMLRLVGHSKKRGIRLIGLCMGDKGSITRILAPIFGSFASYGSFKGCASAPGQLDVETMHSTYHFSSLSLSSKVYALIGDPIEHSLGPCVHNYLFEKKRANAVYIAISMKKEELSEFFSLFRELKPFMGLSITMPLKEMALAFVDQLTPSAKSIGAINTALKKGEVLWGDNTDCLGALLALQRKTPVKGRKALILGSGGAAKAIAYALQKEGASVAVMGRNAQALKELSKRHFYKTSFFEEVDHMCFDIVVNTLPKDAAFPECVLKHASVVMDASYHLGQENIYDKAKDIRPICVYGLDMFLYQLFLQQKLFLQEKTTQQ